MKIASPKFVNRAALALSLTFAASCVSTDPNQNSFEGSALEPIAATATQSPGEQQVAPPTVANDQGASRAPNAAAEAPEASENEAQNPAEQAEEQDPGTLDKAKAKGKELKEKAEQVKEGVEEIQDGVEGVQQDVQVAQKRIADLEAQLTQLQNSPLAGLGSLFTPVKDLANGWQSTVNLRPDGTNLVYTPYKDDEFTANIGVSTIFQGDLEQTLTLTGDWRPTSNPVVSRLQGGLLNLTLNRPPTGGGTTNQLVGVESVVALSVPGVWGLNLETIPFELSNGHIMTGAAVAGVSTDGNNVTHLGGHYFGNLNGDSHVKATLGLTNIGGEGGLIPVGRNISFSALVDNVWDKDGETLTGNAGLAFQNTDGGNTFTPFTSAEWVGEDLGGGAALQLRYVSTSNDAVDGGAGLLLNLFKQSADGSRIGPYVDYGPDGEFTFGMTLSIGMPTPN